MPSSTRYFSCVNCYRKVVADYDVRDFTCEERALHIFRKRPKNAEDDALCRLIMSVSSCVERTTLIDLLGRHNICDAVSDGLNRLQSDDTA